MHAGLSTEYLSDTFLSRVRRAYRSALEVGKSQRVGDIWEMIGDRRADVHDALMRSDNRALCDVFRDPASTDLFYGVENCCRSIDPTTDFVGFAFRSDRNAIALYQADRLRSLLGRGGPVVEIGPGMGRVAYHAFRAGLKDYTTIDLPLGIVAQACFLGATLGPGALWFEGDDPAVAKDRIRILPAGRKPERRFSIALNTDSLTELAPAPAFDCALWLARHADVLLSINHEQNLFTVKELMAISGAGSRTLQQPCPAWPGYIEEVFGMHGHSNASGPRRFAFYALAYGRRCRNHFRPARPRS